MSISPMNEATSWPDAVIAIAGIGMVSALGTLFIWQAFVTLRARVLGASKATAGTSAVTDSIAKGE